MSVSQPPTRRSPLRDRLPLDLKPGLHGWLLVSILLAWLLSALLAPPVHAQDEGDDSATGFRAGGAWQLEFGPMIGYYDFDALTYFEDGLLLGLRLGARRSAHFQLEAEFTEVYTSRRDTGNRARQISAALRGRYEPMTGRLRPSVMLGVAFVGFDDSEDPDSFGDAWDMGLALGYRVDENWVLRAEWILRYQRFTLTDPNLPPELQEGGTQDTWGRSYFLGVYYVF